MHQFKELLHSMLAWVEGFADSPHGVQALFLISFAESSFFPIPPDILLIAMCLGDPSQALFFALVCSIASVSGGVAGYGIGYWGGRPLLTKLFPEARVAAVKSYYDRWNAWATGIAGLTPLPYKIFTISGGAFAVNFRIFFIASVLSRSLRFFAVAGLIALYGEPVKAFIDKYLDVLSIGFVVLLVAGFLAVRRVSARASQEA